MYKCLACRCKLVEAFQHLQHKFLVCRYCFLIFATVNKITSFNRIPILAHSISSEVSRIHKNLLNFADKTQPELSSIYSCQIIDMLQNQSLDKVEEQEISTEYSVSDPDGYGSDKGSYGFYDNYNWIKDRLLVKYQQLGNHGVVKKIETSVKPVIIQISEEGSKIGNKIDKVREELYNLRKQAPNLRDIAKIDFGSLIKAKYKSVFKHT